MVLDLCIPTATGAQDPQLLQETACLLAAPPPLPYVFPTSFPDEVFFHRVVSNPLATPGRQAGHPGPRGRGRLRLRRRRPGQQMVFARIRVTAGVPVRRHLHGHPPVRHRDLPERGGRRRQPRHRLHRGHRRHPRQLHRRAHQPRRAVPPARGGHAHRPADGPALRALPRRPGRPAARAPLRPGHRLHPQREPLLPRRRRDPALHHRQPVRHQLVRDSAGPSIGPGLPDRCIREELFTVTGMLHDPNTVGGKPAQRHPRLLRPHRRRLPGRRDGSRLPEPRPGQSPEAHRRRPVRLPGADGGTRPSSATGTPRASPSRATMSPPRSP